MTKVFAPVSGVLNPVEDANDRVFSAKMLGNGVAIQPFDSIVYSPCDGTVRSLYPDGHAFVIENDACEIMVHIGIDTFELNGECFTPLRRKGDRVFAGDPIVQVDYDYMEELGYATDTMVVAMDKSDIEINDSEYGKYIEVGEWIFNF